MRNQPLSPSRNHRSCRASGSWPFLLHFGGPLNILLPREGDRGLEVFPLDSLSLTVYSFEPLLDAARVLYF